MENLISVIIPVFQVAQYLPKCLDSVLAQTYKNLQIILIDDGSTDGSEKICDEYACIDSRIIVVHKENGGLVSARKAAWSVVKGEFISYVDSDDWIDRDMIETMYLRMMESEADIVVTGHKEEFPSSVIEWRNSIPEGDYVGEKLENQVFSKMLYDPRTYRWSLSPACWDKLYRREVVESFQKNVPDIIWDGEDHAFVYFAVLKAKKISIMTTTPYHHRIRKESVSQAFDKMAFTRLGKLFESLRDGYIQSGYWDIIRKPFAYQMRWFFLKHMKTELDIDVYENGEAVRPYIFPFGKVSAGSCIVLYGAGNVGLTFFQQLKSTGYCRIAAWVSKDYKKHGNTVQSPDSLKSIKFDVVVIAIESERVAGEIRKELNSLGISNQRIVWKNPTMERVELK